MSRPIAPIVLIRMTAAFTKKGATPQDAVKKAQAALSFIEEAGLDVVVPGWVPVDEPEPAPTPRWNPPKVIRTWDDLPRVTIEGRPWENH